MARTGTRLSQFEEHLAFCGRREGQGPGGRVRSGISVTVSFMTGVHARGLENV